MKRLILICSFFGIMAACGQGAGDAGEDDSVSTESIPDPSYNPTVETDSGAKQMNLDSTQVEDTTRHK